MKLLIIVLLTCMLSSCASVLPVCADCNWNNYHRVDKQQPFQFTDDHLNMDFAK